MEIAFPYAGNLEVLYRPHEGKEVAGVVAVGLVGCVSKYIARSSRIRGSRRPRTNSLSSASNAFTILSRAFFSRVAFPPF
jgi:hypothetical protein